MALEAQRRRGWVRFTVPISTSSGQIQSAVDNGGRLDRGNLMLSQGLAHDVQPGRQRRIAEDLFGSARSVPADGRKEGFLRFDKSLWA